MINNVCNRFLFQLITITLSLFLLTEVSARPSRKANAHSKPSPHFKHGGKGHASKGRNFRGGFRGPKFAEPFHRGSGKKKSFSNNRRGSCNKSKCKRGGPPKGKGFGGLRQKFQTPRHRLGQTGLGPRHNGPMNRFAHPRFGGPKNRPPMGIGSPRFHRVIPEFKSAPKSGPQRSREGSEPKFQKGPREHGKQVGPPWLRRDGDRPHPGFGPQDRGGKPEGHPEGPRKFVPRNDPFEHKPNSSRGHGPSSRPGGKPSKVTPSKNSPRDKK